jgi:hypothetical protein
MTKHAVLGILVLFSLSANAALKISKELPQTVRLQVADGSIQTFKVSVRDPWTSISRASDGGVSVNINQWNCSEPDKLKGFLVDKITFRTVDEFSEKRVITIDPARSSEKIAVSESCLKNPSSNGASDELASIIIGNLDARSFQEVTEQ